MDTEVSIVNQDAIRMLSEEWVKVLPSIDKDAMKDILQLPSSTVLFILYENTLLMRKYNSRTLNFDAVPHILDSATDSFAEVKVIRSIFDYLRKKLDQAEGFDKVPYLESLKEFLNWLHDEVKFSTKQ
jgi:hypothetical protein